MIAMSINEAENTDTNISIKEIKLALIRNNYSEINVPILDLVKIIRPTPALLIKHECIPTPCYNAVGKKLYPNAVGGTKIDDSIIEARIRRTIEEITTEPVVNDEVYNALAASGEHGRLAIGILTALATGGLELITGQDLIMYAIAQLEQDALSTRGRVSRILGIEGTIAGYDIDISAGLYVQHHEHELLKLSLKTQAGMFGRQLIG